MVSRDYRDIATGAVLGLGGLAYAGYAAGKYDLGTVSEMGPGMFPLGLGVLLAAFGTMILVPALFRAGSELDIEFRPAAAVLASIAAFALCIRPFGLVPAIFALTAVASFAHPLLRLRTALMLAGGIALAAVLIFVVGLGMLIPIARWPA